MRIQARDYWRLAAVAMLASGCGAAQAQVGLGAGVLGIGTVMLLGLALLGVAAWAALSGLLWLGARYAGRPWRFWQVARGVALAGVIGLIALGSVSFLRVAQGLWGRRIRRSRCLVNRWILPPHTRSRPARPVRRARAARR
ncbi:MAG: hypothetical protein IPL70_08280 [Uliginosibacterium sp.]|nr:hypothetical protein [Uliginosibacterium sp.]